jgi:hypothetical protein
MEPLRKRLRRKLDLKMSKTGRMANSSLCEKCRLVKPRGGKRTLPRGPTLGCLSHQAKPRRGKRIQPRVSTLGCLPHQATRPERAQERISPRRRFHRKNVMLLPLNLPAFQGGSVLSGVFPGLKPWAESCCPFRDRPAGSNSLVSLRDRLPHFSGSGR